MACLSFNFGLETVLDHYDLISWNIPGLNPEYIVGFPNIDVMIPYLVREYNNWKNITLGMGLRPRRLNIAYTHIIDGMSYRKQPLDPFYLDLSNHVEMLNKLSDIEIMIVSDHGVTPDGIHPVPVYLGCTHPVSANSVLGVRKDIENILNVGSEND